MTTTLMPLAKQQFNQNGAPLSGGQLFVYAAGTTNKATTYTDGSGETPNTNPIILDANGQASVWLDPDVFYKFVLSPSTDTDPPTNPFWTLDNISAAASSAQLANTEGAGGAALIGFDGTTLDQQFLSRVNRVVDSLAALRALSHLTYTRAFVSAFYSTGEWYGGGDYVMVNAVAPGGWENNGTQIVASDGAAWLRIGAGTILSPTMWGAKFDGSTDDTAAWISAITAVYNAGGGVLTAPGAVSMVSSIAFEFAAATSVRIIGAGRAGTTIRSIGETAPILELSASAGVLDVYSEISNLCLDGVNKTTGCHGFQATTLANLKTENLGIINCDTGFNSLGCLVSNHYQPSWNSNNNGYLANVSGGIYSNAVNFYGGTIKANTSWGMQLLAGSGFNFNGVDIESNGTSGNVQTGALVTSGTISAEAGLSSINLSNCWFEANLGQTISINGGTGICFTMRDTLVLSSEGGRAINIGSVLYSELNNIQAASAGDTVNIAASTSVVIGGVINTLNDTSNNRVCNAAIGEASNPGWTSNGLIIQGGAAKFDTTYPLTNTGDAYVDGGLILSIKDPESAGNQTAFYATNGAQGGSGFQCAMAIGSSSTTNRSINAGGTVNASGDDYAEYEVKASSCGTIVKGAIVGFNSSGQLTDQFALAVTFGVKSTAPSYVGGDNWFTQPAPATPAKPTMPSLAVNATAAQQAAYQTALTAYQTAVAAYPAQLAAYQAALTAYETQAEAARAAVDRIAYAGKVPVNVTGAAVGDYIVPQAASDGSISGVVVTPSAITLAQYQIAVGRVRSILSDGRAQIVIKTA